MIRQTDIFLNGRKCTLGEGQVVALTRQINDIGDIKSRQSNLTNTFRIDYFGENEKHLNFAGRPGSMSKYPYRFLPARVVQNGFEIIRNGGAIIRSMGAHSASVTVYWGNSDFFDRLNFSLRELDLSELDHIFEISSINQLGGAKNWDVFYPFCEFGNNSVYRHERPVQSQSLIALDILKAYPAVKCVYILQKIAAKLGFTFSGSIFDDVLFRNLSLQLQEKIPTFPNKEDYFVKSENTTASGTFVLANLSIWPFTHDAILKDNTPDSFPPTPIHILTTAISNARYVNNTGKRGWFRFRATLNHVFTRKTPPYQVVESDYAEYRVVIRRLPHAGGVRDVPGFQESESFSTPRIYEFEVMLHPLDAVYLYISCGRLNDFSVLPGSTFETIDITVPDLVINDLVSVAQSMPDITAADFIKTIAQMHGIIFDTSSRQVRWVTFADIVQTKGQNTPWPVKIIKDSTVTEFDPGKYYQKNHIAYKSGATPEKLSSMFEIDNKTLDKEDTLIELEAYLPDVYEKTGIGHILHILMYGENENKSELDMPFFLFQEWPQFFTDTTPEAVQTRYAYTSGNLNEYTSTPFTFPVSIASGNVQAITRLRRGEPEAKPEGISPAAIIETNYRDFINVLRKFKKYTVSCYLSEPEFYALSHYEAYYVPELFTFVHVEKISNYVAGKPCQITLIAI